MSLKCLVRRFMMFISGMVCGCVNAGISGINGIVLVDIRANIY